MIIKNYSQETFAVLRNTHLSFDCGVTADGDRFVRCHPRPMMFNEHGDGWHLPKELARAQCCRVVREVNEAGVFVSWHPEVGDYVQVRETTETFRLICQMKS